MVYTELYLIQLAYYSGDYERVIEIGSADFSAVNVPSAQVLVARAKIALGQAEDVVTEYANVTDEQADLGAVRALALYTLGNKEASVESIDSIIAESKDNHNVQYLGGIILVLENRLDEAIELLSLHEGSLEAISLLVHIYLIKNQLDLATKEITSAKKWAQDNVVFNLAESWVDLRTGGNKYQQAYYIYEELASGGTQTAKSCIGQVVSQLMLARYPETETSLTQALELDPQNPDALISSIAYSIITGKPYEESLQ